MTQAQDRRDQSERRQRELKFSGKNKRKTLRRKADKVEARKEALLYYMGLGVGYAILFAAYFAVLIKAM